jgi:RNA polymerase sigma-70 factor (ECF subfamily)
LRSRRRGAIVPHLDTEDEGELLRKWRAGDRAAGNALFQRHVPAAHRFFVNKADGQAGDLVQTTFLRICDSIDRFEGRSSFRVYMFGVAHNVLREFVRRKIRDSARDLDELSIADLGAGPSTLVAARQEQALLYDALRHIPIEQQIALELYFWEKLTGPELAEVLEIPEATVRSRLQRGKQNLSKALEKLRPKS